MLTLSELKEHLVQRGRRTASRWRHVALPQWALLMPNLSDAALRVYALLLAHVNATDGDREAWPQQQSMAAMLGRHRNSIGRAIKELAEAGLVDVEVERYGTNNSRRRNIYIVHELPPGDYDGPASITEWYAAHPRPEPEPINRRDRKTAGQPGRTKNSASERTNTSASEGTADSAGMKLKRNETKGESSSPSLLHSAPPSAVEAGAEEEEEETTTNSPIGGTESPLLSSNLNPSSSSADRSQATDSTSHGTKRRTSPEVLIVDECGATPEEAAALVDHIRRQGEARRSLSGYVRHLVANGDMAERLRSLRAARAVPTSRHPADEHRCGLHGTPMPGGTCSSCAGDIKCGDVSDVVDYYQSLTPEERDTRADLKRLLESRGLIESEEVAA